MIELLVVFALLAAIWGVIGSRAGASDDPAGPVVAPIAAQPHKRGAAARRLLG